MSVRNTLRLRPGLRKYRWRHPPSRAKDRGKRGFKRDTSRRLEGGLGGGYRDAAWARWEVQRHGIGAWGWRYWYNATERRGWRP